MFKTANFFLIFDTMTGQSPDKDRRTRIRTDRKRNDPRDKDSLSFSLSISVPKFTHAHLSLSLPRTANTLLSAGVDIDLLINRLIIVICTVYTGGGVKAGEEGQIEPIQLPISAAEMQASSSSDKYFASEKTAGEGGLFDSQTMTKTSSSIMESSTTHTSLKKEYVSTTSTSNLSSCPVHQPTSLCVKKTSQTSEQSSAYNGAPPVVQVS